MIVKWGLSCKLLNISACLQYLCPLKCYLNGFHGDCSEMFVVGGKKNLDEDGIKLLQVTYDSWIQAMEFVKPGNDYKDIGGIIEDYITSYGFTTVRNFCGHGIGSVFHTNPNIYHYKNSEPNGQMAAGHTFTIEPMICEGIGRLHICASPLILETFFINLLMLCDFSSAL